MMRELEVTLSSNIEYVAGTVNGIDTVFLQDEYNTVKWRAAVDVSDNDTYAISLQMYDAAGNVGHFEDTVRYVMPQFVCNRTQSDIDYAKYLSNKIWHEFTDREQQEWNKGLKGCFNHSDMERIENNIKIIAGLVGVETDTYAVLPACPDNMYFEKLLYRVGLLRSSGYRHQDTPEVPQLPINTYEQLNDIETILRDTYSVYMMQYHYYAGEIYSDDSVLI